ncbi:MAG TPA: aspartate/glutamate racemase family protein [Candidatus Blautia merdipullorum]|nr:aspartate/glutamate racemase family protein [Candidatus Blautia merdipullorum]
MSKKIAVIHTSLTIFPSMDKEILRQIPDADIHNIIDVKILSDVMKNGGINEDIKKRMTMYVLACESMGADIILNACSSVGEAFDVAQSITTVPCLKIDQAMAEEAAEVGSNIAVYGTVGTTLEPSARLIERVAAEKGKSITVTKYLIDGAFQILSEGDTETHNKMVLKKIMETKDDHDVIVLAQASMAVLIPEMKDFTQPVLYSLVSGVTRLKECLEK